MQVFDPTIWTVGHMVGFDPAAEPEDLEAELALAVEAFQGVKALYKNAVEREVIVICERIV
jgi:hypothetical protein